MAKVQTKWNRKFNRLNDMDMVESGLNLIAHMYFMLLHCHALNNGVA